MRSRLHVLFARPAYSAGTTKLVGWFVECEECGVEHWIWREECGWREAECWARLLARLRAEDCRKRRMRRALA